MGTFASLCILEDKGIPEDKQSEFMQKVQKVFYAGGMMKYEYEQFLGEKFILLDRSVEMDEYGLDFNYNYFEDDFWENAGFNKNSFHIYSNKSGCRAFLNTILAAYVLEGQYREGINCVECDGDLVCENKFTGWLNYLFHEKKYIKNSDSWKLYVSLQKQKDNLNYGWDEDKINSLDFLSGINGYCHISYLEIQSVIHGTKKALSDKNILQNIEEKDTLDMWHRILKILLESLEEYLSMDIPEDEQLNTLKELIHNHYAGKQPKKYETDCLNHIACTLSLTNSPVILMKRISEIYNRDFWELYSEFEEEEHRENAAFEEIFHFNAENYYISEITTKDFFKLNSHQLILYWGEYDDIELDEEIWSWFEEIKKEYDKIIDSDFTVTNMPVYIIDLLQYAYENYYNIFAFKDFFEETLCNLNDRRYVAFWKQFESMLHNPEFEKWGDVIFITEDEEKNSNNGIFGSHKKLKRRLKTYWDLMSNELKNNKARVLLKDYMALAANKKLRLKVFGF